MNQIELRDQFAIMILQGFLASDAGVYSAEEDVEMWMDNPEYASKMAYCFADVMLVERAKSKELPAIHKR